MMDFYYAADHVLHDPQALRQPGTHSESYYCEVAARGVALHDALLASGWGARRAPLDFGLAPLLAVHDAGMVQFLQTAYDRFAQEAGEARPVIPDTYSVQQRPRRWPRTIFGQLGGYCFDTSAPIFAGTWQAAYWSAQTALSAAARVHGGAPVAYGLCRPPGHHAHADLYGGFCYLNNAAAAAAWLARQGQRVAVVDVDYHHGNGTQAIFYERADVFVCSIHADPYDEYPYYWGHADETGVGAGAGFNLNLPLPLGADEAAYLAALQRALERVVQFQPETLLISLGLDTALGDPTGTFRLQRDSFWRMGAAFAALRLPTVVVQEGGYRLDTLGENVTAFFQGLLGDDGQWEVVSGQK